MSSTADPGDRRAAHSDPYLESDRTERLLTTSAPRLETERLTLRHFREDDLDAYAETMGNPEVMRHLGSDPLSREESWRRLLSGAGFWSVTGIGVWAVERRADQCMIGHVGFFDFHRDMEPSIEGEPEMGWIFSPDGQGRGLATEAGLAALAWFDRSFGPVTIPAIIAPENMPSIRLAERLGFERVDDAIYRGEAIALFRRPPQGL